MFWGRRSERLKEQQAQERIKFKAYDPIILTGNIPEVLKKLDGRIVLLQSEHLGKYYHRGELSYDERDPEVIFLKNYRNSATTKNRVHVHDITGLMIEV